MRGLRVGLIDMVIAVVVLSTGEVDVVALDLAAECLEARRLGPLSDGERSGGGGDDVLPDGTVVKKWWTVMYSDYAMGRSENV